ncbi:nucleotidyl transferase AbiEii/AbiGii toxin family protein [Hymenobacter sp. H14-R3]|uniref:nucleotidyl transferase AbiEii/AbiGii toxin family protein n=1 Tax=Hymenobacter sp. H14-R3 TaxID=3046308 RepID=UPI0024BABA22|nr:nucleotidyl transferase AbiEii/AbiGii toxin family protein [Hymenobacter sp. H14-R3]MDJ0364866.1 nucleotidyl transferase AbiEii/AbiGii toxin family protein [Hymenobacter sp. H14-R3]
MSTIYPISPERLQPAGLGLAMAALQRGFAYFGIDFYIVGAVARDIWLTQIYDEPDRRTTKDLDLAIFIHDTAEYEALQAWLVEQEGFVLAQSSAFCLLYHSADGPGNVTVDLMPFGAIADEAGDVYFSGRGMERISTVGFTEVLADAATVTIPTGEQWRIVTLPGIVVLKLVAWQDRPERGKDAIDIWNLLAVYFDLITDDVYANHLDLFAEEETPDTTNLTLLVGARVLGRQIHQLLADRPVQGRLLALLADQLTLGEVSPLARAMSRQGPEIATCLAALNALRAGLEDAWPPPASSE